jgi:hypothetical protein
VNSATIGGAEPVQAAVSGNGTLAVSGVSVSPRNCTRKDSIVT